MAEPNVDMDALEITFPVASETPYKRYDWTLDSEYLEVLRCTPEAIDFSRLNAGASVLRNHNSDDVVGTVIASWIEDAKLYVRVKMRQADEAVRALFADMANGILRNVSIGYMHDKVERDGEYGYVTRWTPLEVSVAVGVPADPTVGMFRSADAAAKVLRRSFETPAEEKTETPAEEKTETPAEEKSDAPAEAPAEKEATVEELQKEIAELKAQLAAAEEKSDAPAEEKSDAPAEETGDAPADETAEAEKSEEDLEKADCPEAGEIRALAKIAAVPEKETAACIRRGMTLNEFRNHISTLNINSRKDHKMSKYSLLRALQAAAGMNVDASVERQTSNELYAEIGLRSSNPNAIMVRANEFLGTGDGAQGAGLIGTDHRGDLFVELLRPKMGVRNFTALTGLRGNVEIPVQTASTTAETVGINAALTNQQPSVGTLNLSPKKFGATVTIGKDLLAQANPDAVAFVLRDIEAQIARKLDQTILTGNSNPAIAGVAGTTGVQTVAIANIANATWADMLKFFGKIGQYDLSTMPQWVMSAADAQTFKGLSKDSGSGRFILEDGKIDGFDVNISGMISTGSIFLGNWADIIVGQWGGLEVIVDPYTQARSGMLVITATLLADVGVRNPEGFVIRSAE